jgi:mannose-1-phosphate guanylyltransferase/phosphomannomutase
VQILEPRVFEHMEELPPRQRFSTTRDTYPRMLTRGERLFGFAFDGFWQDLGTPERIREAEEKLSSGRAGLHFLDPV